MTTNTYSEVWDLDVFFKGGSTSQEFESHFQEDGPWSEIIASAELEPLSFVLEDDGINNESALI